jgi:hypothetical protein
VGINRILNEVNEEKNKICENLGVDGQDYKLKASGENLLNGSAFANGKGVRLSKVLLKMWDEDKNIVKFMLAHELVHAKYGDNNIAVIKDRSISKLMKNAVILLSEMRANKIGASVIGLSDEEMNRVQKKLHIENEKRHGDNLLIKLSRKLKFIGSYEYAYEECNDHNIKFEFGKGYPPRKMIADFSYRYNDFSDMVKDDLLEKFYMLFKSEISVEKDEFKNRVLKYFKTHYEGKKSKE